MFYKCIVPTPLPTDSKSLSYNEVHQSILAEFRNQKSWTEECTSSFMGSPNMVLSYDRLEYFIGKAFGRSTYKILLNPIMVLCYHPSCIVNETPPIRLSSPCSIHAYLIHLASHLTDAVGKSMYSRFSTLYSDPFCEDYDSICASPYSLMIDDMKKPDGETLVFMKSYAIKRDFNPAKTCYITHWKNIFIMKKLISSRSLSFQEDDALITMALSYPEPVKRWSFWDTLSTYCLKLYTYISPTANSLFRGNTSYPALCGKTKTLEDFIRDINHPGPGNSTIQRWLPAASHENEQYHTFNIRFHLKVLSKQENSLVLKFDRVRRYLVTLVIDEQEINQGTYINTKKGTLSGLAKELSADEIRRISLKNLGKYVMTQCKFVNAVQEFRLTDLKGIHCSNVMTQFQTSADNSSDCKRSLESAIQFSNSCENCLKAGLRCKYKKLREQCESCALSNLTCVSMNVWHVFWDMASCHTKTEKEINCLLNDISTTTELELSSTYTMGFGFLHMLKSITNHTRNYSLSHGKVSYGVHVLRALKNQEGPHTELMENIKTSVLVGKDRQSDYNSYMVSSKIVQETLKAARYYKAVRLPEPVLSYTKNARSQKRIVKPSGLVCNENGDCFILDSGAACLHVIGRKSVTKVSIVGKYSSPIFEKYAGNCCLSVSDLKFSNNLTDISFHNGDLFVVDCAREAIVILRNCTLAKRVKASKVDVIRKKGILSLCCIGEKVVCLCKKDDKWVLECLKIDVQNPGENEGRNVTAKVSSKLDLEAPGTCLVPMTDSVFGLMVDNLNWNLFQLSKGKLRNTSLQIQSLIKPMETSGGVFLSSPNCQGRIEKLGISLDLKTGSISLGEKVALEFEIPSTTRIACCHGNGFYWIEQHGSRFQLVECFSVDFGLELSAALNCGYKAACYIPPHGDRGMTSKSIDESIELAEKLVDLLGKIQDECKIRYPTRNSFCGDEGALATGTLYCLRTTVASWKTFRKRLAHFDATMIPQVNPYTLINELLIEHSFGFTFKKGQGQNMSKEEYLHAKNKFEVDFQLRMCKCEFNQYNKIKNRDKGYQHLDETFITPLSQRDIFEMLSYKEEEGQKVDLVEADYKILHKAFLLLKKQPRQSNRTKWREKAGFAPNLLIEDDTGDKFYSGDMVFTKDVLGVLRKHIVSKDLLISSLDDMVLTIDVLSRAKEHIPITSLIMDQGLYAVLPSTYFTYSNAGLLCMTDVGDQYLDELCEQIDQPSTVYTDEELSALPDIDVTGHRIILDDDEEEDNQDGGGSVDDLFDMNDDGDVANNSDGDGESDYSDDQVEAEPLKKRRKICSINSDSSDEEEDCNVSFMKHDAVQDDWVAVIYEDTPYFGQVVAIDATHGYQVKTLTNDRTNFFKWSKEREIWYRKIEFLAEPPSPANNRGAYRFTDTDFQRLNNLIHL